MNTTQQVWTKQFNSITERIAASGAVRETADGFQWIDEEVAGAVLVDQYRSMLSAGYARGWV